MTDFLISSLPAHPLLLRLLALLGVIAAFAAVVWALRAAQALAGWLWRHTHPVPRSADKSSLVLSSKKELFLS